MSRSVSITSTWMRSPLLPRIPIWAAIAAQDHAKAIVATAAASTSTSLSCQQRQPQQQQQLLSGTVIGGTTAAVRDIGGASLRLKIPEIEEGGYLLALRRINTDSRTLDDDNTKCGWLPAIAGVPGRRYGAERVGLAECMIFARPVILKRVIDDKFAGSGGTVTNSIDCQKLDQEQQRFIERSDKAIGVNQVLGGEVTFLPDDVLRAYFGEQGSSIEVLVLQRVTNFFVGLNAGRWLQIRMNEISQKSVEWLEECQDGRKGRAGDCDDGECATTTTPTTRPHGSRSSIIGEKYTTVSHDTTQISVSSSSLIETLLDGTGLVHDRTAVGDPPEDSSYLFEHFGMSNNSPLPSDHSSLLYGSSSKL